LSPYAQQKRFKAWRKQLPAATAYLVDQVLARIVPEFERRGFVWYPNYAGADPNQIGRNEIPLQRRRGESWPTVQLSFNKNRRPNFHLNFSALPPVCRRWNGSSYLEIPREEALVFEGPAYFSLCKGRSATCEFGYQWFAFLPHRYLASEVGCLSSLLPELYALFDRGIPSDWLTRGFGHVTEHVLVMPSRAPAKR
jgi:hypothetical protein